MKWATLLVSASLIAGLALVILPADEAQAALPLVTVSGDHFHVGGADITEGFYGVDETTALIFCVDAYVNGATSYWGKNMNFPTPDTGVIDTEDLAVFWDCYFACCAYYDLNLVRIGAGDSWGTEMLYEAWADHPVSFYKVLNAMLGAAMNNSVYVSLVLAGSQEFPVYDFRAGAGEEDPFNTTHDAYDNYMSYLASVMGTLDLSSYTSAIFCYDVWNEPDHNSVNTGYWGGDQLAFKAWAQSVSWSACSWTAHVVDMGVGGYDTLFGWNQASFNNVTGQTNFDVCHWHFYASAEDTYLVTDPLSWADDVNKPLVIGEVARNDVYPLVRWFWYEATYFANGGEACVNMVLRGTDDYPLVVSVTATDQEATEGHAFSYTPTATFSEHNAWGLDTDSGAEIDPATGEITWMPEWTDEGEYYLNISVEHPCGDAYELVTLTVLNNDDLDPISVGAISSNVTTAWANTSVSYSVSVSGGVGVYSYVWAFGDGYYSSAASPTHAYLSSGTYHVTCKVNGTYATNSITMTINAPPVPEPEPEPEEATVGGIIAQLMPFAVIGMFLMVMVALVGRH